MAFRIAYFWGPYTRVIFQVIHLLFSCVCVCVSHAYSSCVLLAICASSSLAARVCQRWSVIILVVVRSPIICFHDNRSLFSRRVDVFPLSVQTRSSLLTCRWTTRQEWTRLHLHLAVFRRQVNLQYPDNKLNLFNGVDSNWTMRCTTSSSRIPTFWFCPVFCR